MSIEIGWSAHQSWGALAAEFDGRTEVRRDHGEHDGDQRQQRHHHQRGVAAHGCGDGEQEPNPAHDPAHT
jgi:hypothetical protein